MRATSLQRLEGGKTMGAERNYSRFYILLKKMPGADKNTLVYKYTNGRTTHIHETTQQEYNSMCNDMERVAGFDERREAIRKELRRKRSVCLKADAAARCGYHRLGASRQLLSEFPSCW